MTKTLAQHARNDARDNSGRYIANPCHCCRRGAPVSDYYSDDRCNGDGNWGFGLVLCKRCATKLAGVSDETYSKLAVIRREHPEMKLVF